MGPFVRVSGGHQLAWPRLAWAGVTPHPRDSRLVSNVEKYHRQTWDRQEDARDEGWVGIGGRGNMRTQRAELWA